MKKALALVVGLAVAGSLAFAAGSGDKATSGSAGGKVVMGALIRNLDEDFVRIYADNLKALAVKNNVDLKLLDARNDQANQLDQLNTLLSQGVKYFVIVPVQTEMTEQMTQAINKKGGGASFSNIQPSVAALKVSKNFFHASSPESVAGAMQADIIDSYFKKNPAKLGANKGINAIMLLGQLGHPAQVLRTDAVLNGLKAKGYAVTVIAKDTANWKPDEAQQKMDAWISAYKGQFNIVIANNDGMALGAVESLLTNKYTDDPADPKKDVDGDGTVLKVPVLGVDATPVALQSMAENKLFATVLQDAAGQSSTAFALTYQMATKGSAIGMVAAGVSACKAVTPGEAPSDDPAVIAQCYLVPFKAVTKDNYKSFIK
jgi:methyl-galactoside transport system substrate-binding protein